MFLNNNVMTEKDKLGVFAEVSIGFLHWIKAEFDAETGVLVGSFITEFLRANGMIEGSPKFHKTGDKWLISTAYLPQDEYMLCIVDECKYALVSTSDGNRWSDAKEHPCKPSKVPEQFVKELIGSEKDIKYKKVYSRE